MKLHYRLAVVWKCFLSPHSNLFLSLLGWAGLHFPATQTSSGHSTDTSQGAVLCLDTADGEQSVKKGTRGRKRSSLRFPPLHLLYLVLRFHSSAPSPKDLSFLHHRQLARGNWLSTNYLGLSGGSAGKKSACIGRDLGLIPRLGRSPGEGNGNPLPVFLPGEFHGQRSLVGYSPWGHKELDLNEQLTLSWHTNYLLFISFCTLKDNVRGTKTKHNGYPNDLISDFMKRGMPTLCGRSPPQQAET